MSHRFSLKGGKIPQLSWGLKLHFHVQNCRYEASSEHVPTQVPVNFTNTRSALFGPPFPPHEKSGQDNSALV